MTEKLRFLPAGDNALLVELDDLETTLTLLDALIASPLEGVQEMVPAARTLLMSFDPRVTSKPRLISSLCSTDLSARSARHGNSHDIPVVYDGEDLVDVAKMLGQTVEEVVRRHTQATYTVAFTGFAPGFAYMTCDDAGLDMPRRKSPRIRIPAGSVALGGKFCGIYPSDSPGGWQLLGRTPLEMWDTARSRAALLAPGDRVRFRPVAETTVFASAARSVRASGPASCLVGFQVTRADRPALFQDLGRFGHANQGVSGSGALDRHSLAEANQSVGNLPGSAALEVILGGFAIKVDRHATLAVTGATCPLSIRTAQGRTVAAPFGRPFALDAGDELELGYPAEGMRSYLALRGGFQLDRVLDSASTDTLAKIGPAPVVVGAVLSPANISAGAVDPFRAAQKPLPRTGDTVTLDVLLGPRTDWFTEAGVATLSGQEWTVTAESSRVGMRLNGPDPVQRRDEAELLSEGTVRGAIQVPHNGQPVLFLSDHPLTGGYPVIGVVARHHLDLAGQIPIGAKIRFNTVAAFDPLFRETDR